MLVIHDESWLGWLRPEYDSQHLAAIGDRLAAAGTLQFPCLESDLFSAASVTADTAYCGYAATWVRDNVHIAHAHLAVGRASVAAGVGRALMAHFRLQTGRMQAIIDRPGDAAIPMNRPHVRFDGRSLTDIDEKWPHAQNDALGYFLWLYGRLVQLRLVEPASDDWECLSLLVRYLEAISFWEDEDSGHWEENRKVSASSIGAVVAGLRELERAALEREKQQLAPTIRRLMLRGREALDAILPAECVQSDPTKQRRYDAALLFLVHPLAVVEGDLAMRIVDEVVTHLGGDHGIRRYRGDSFWSPDYKRKLAPEKRTVDFSEDLASRDRLTIPGLEAQWCLFDPVISTIYGRAYRRTHDDRYLRAQTHHFNRALGQLTAADCAFGAMRCPELYYLEDEHWVPSDATPLLWTQATLLEAMKTFEDVVRSQDS